MESPIKKCSKCKKEKALKEFAKRLLRFQSFCKECNKKYNKNHYQKNKNKYLEDNAKRREKNKKWFKELKSGLFCETCGENHIAVLDFHHKDQDLKLKNISEMIYACFTKEKIKKEIEKCKVLCSNCHRKLHYEESLLS